MIVRILTGSSSDDYHCIDYQLVGEFPDGGEKSISLGPVDELVGTRSAARRQIDRGWRQEGRARTKTGRGLSAVPCARGRCVKSARKFDLPTPDERFPRRVSRAN